jgi:3-hydroxyisobutyrate dehydrogenase
MKASIIGIGDMGRDIAGHVHKGRHDLLATDIDAQRRADGRERGLNVVDTLAEAVKGAEVHLVVVATDEQSETVSREIVKHADKGSIIVILSTNGIETMQQLSAEMHAQDFGFVDAPVCFGRSGARDGTLVSLCGGSEEEINRIRPVLDCYSRAVHRVGDSGAGQLAKACNNMLHWEHCVGNYEVLLLAKRYGVDAQRMRETLLDCPATNGTLARWDDTRFTWQEKDMDLALEMAQSAGLSLPLFGQIDQLVKHLNADRVAALLYGYEAEYLGLPVKAMKKEEGGINR